MKDLVNNESSIYCQNCSNWDFVKKLSEEDYIELGYKRKRGRSWYRCKICGKLKCIEDSNFKRRVTVCDKGCHGETLNTKEVIKGVNDIATTHTNLIKYFVDENDVFIYRANSVKEVPVKCPDCGVKKKMKIQDLTQKGFHCDNCNSIKVKAPHVVKYFINEEDAIKYGVGSHQKVVVRCPECGFKKETIISNLVIRGFNCPICGDGISYPETFVSNLLKHLNIEFISQFSLDNNKHRYDFYLIEYRTIIETHGIQHYEYTSRGRTLEEEIRNDEIKRNIALDNKYNYVVIDSRYSELKWMKENIMSSELPILLNFKEEDIDWLKIEKDSANSLVKEVCDYFNNSNNITTSHIQKVFGLSKVTIIKYLKKGTEFGWCNYDPKDFKGGIAYSKRVKGIHKTTGETVIFPSAKEAQRSLGKNGECISLCCNGKRKSAYGYYWSWFDENKEN